MARPSLCRTREGGPGSETWREGRGAWFNVSLPTLTTTEKKERGPSTEGNAGLLSADTPGSALAVLCANRCPFERREQKEGEPEGDGSKGGWRNRDKRKPAVLLRGKRNIASAYTHTHTHTHIQTCTHSVQPPIYAREAARRREGERGERGANGVTTHVYFRLFLLLFSLSFQSRPLRAS